MCCSRPPIRSTAPCATCSMPTEPRAPVSTYATSIRTVIPAEFVAVQQKYNIVAGRTEDGRVVTDAAIVLASRGRHWFITPDDLVDFSEVDDGRTKSRLEQALTEGVRAILGGTRSKVCFTYGHGEFSIEDNTAQGLGELRDRLEKNNYETVMVIATETDPSDAYEQCEALVVPGPSHPFSKEEADAIAARMRKGMSGLFMLNPMLDAERKMQLDTGLESVARIFGIGIANDYVFEGDDDARVPRGTGEVFFPELLPHDTTEGLVGPSLAVAGLRGGRHPHALARSSQCRGEAHYNPQDHQQGIRHARLLPVGGEGR